MLSPGTISADSMTPADPGAAASLPGCSVVPAASTLPSSDFPQANNVSKAATQRHVAMTLMNFPWLVVNQDSVGIIRISPVS
jgi:hypothetical protein